jgi:demethylmenaquinone methyltransferase / 2-methoxy-6-polyprenyl-1,4-benzoquinol methylase
VGTPSQTHRESHEPSSLTRGRRAADAQALEALDLETHLGDPALKQRFVTPMFDVIAPRYDDFTRAFSFGMDASWKRELIALAASELPDQYTALDVACGTGDLALALARARPGGRVTGIDVVPGMIQRAAVRGAGVESVTFGVADLTRLPFPDASVDLVTAGYALRNVPSYEVALRELARVLRPGGCLLTLDFYRPSFAPWRVLFLGYLSVAGSLCGWAWHRAPVVYRYIARSIAHFVTARDFTCALGTTGFRVLTVRRMLQGGVAIHHATRRRD